MIRRSAAALVALAFLPYEAQTSESEQSSESSHGLLDSLASRGVVIQRAFSGPREKRKDPATFTYVDGNEEDNFYSIFAAIGYDRSSSKAAQDRNAERAVRLYDEYSLEYQRLTESGEELNKLTARASVELFDPHSRASVLGSSCTGTLTPGEDQSDFDSAIIGGAWAEPTAELTRDLRNNETSGNAAVWMGFGTTCNGSLPVPGRQTPLLGTNAFFYWQPTVGFENRYGMVVEQGVGESQQEVASGEDESFWAYSIHVQSNVFALFSDSDIASDTMLSAEYTVRNLFGDNAFIDERSRLTTVKLSIPLDGDGRASLSATYYNSDTVDTNFNSTERLEIGLGFKLHKN